MCVCVYVCVCTCVCAVFVVWDIYKKRMLNISDNVYIFKLRWFGLVWFYGTSTIVGYLMLNPFDTYRQFYFKQFSLV